MEPTPDDVKRYVSEGLACELVEVEGDGRHFTALIVATGFEGLNRVARHKLVYAALGDRMASEIHALTMRTLTPSEYEELQR
jgi:acid stress-induced BolA-like protein IbaG/YrbA